MECWFATAEERDRFRNLVYRAYRSAQQVTEVSGIATGDARHAVLLTRLVRRMLAYNEDASGKLISPENLADLDAHADALWPYFEEILDESLAVALGLIKDAEGEPN